MILISRSASVFRLAVLASLLFTASLSGVIEIKRPRGDTPQTERVQPSQDSGAPRDWPAEKRVNLNRLMSPAEQQRTGVDTLTEQQRLALEEWLHGYKVEVEKSTTDNTFFYRVSRNFNSGAEIHLDNGDVWKVAPLYRRVANHWLKGHRIEVSRKARMGSAYPNQLYNQSTGETVDARLSRSAQ